LSYPADVEALAGRRIDDLSPRVARELRWILAFWRDPPGAEGVAAMEALAQHCAGKIKRLAWRFGGASLAAEFESEFRLKLLRCANQYSYKNGASFLQFLEVSLRRHAQSISRTKRHRFQRDLESIDLMAHAADTRQIEIVMADIELIESAKKELSEIAFAVFQIAMRDENIAYEAVRRACGVRLCEATAAVREFKSWLRERYLNRSHTCHKTKSSR
jgi:hypothetical protein